MWHVLFVNKKLTKIGQICPWQLLKENTAAYRGSPPWTQSQHHSNRGTGTAMYQMRTWSTRDFWGSHENFFRPQTLLLSIVLVFDYDTDIVPSHAEEPNLEKGHHRGTEAPNIIETLELLWQLRLLTSISQPCVLETQNHYTDRIITFLLPICDTFGAWCKEFRQTSFWYTYICSYNHIEHLLKTVIINEWIEMQLGVKHNMILHKKGMLIFSGLFPDMYPKVFSVLRIGGEKYLCQFEPNDCNVFNVEYTMKICIMQCIICIIIF